MEETGSLLQRDESCVGANQPTPKSFPDFQRLFPDEQACRTYLYSARFTGGFKCPYCNWIGTPYRFQNYPDMLRCRNCHRNTRLTAGTIMQKSQFPLNT